MALISGAIQSLIGSLTGSAAQRFASNPKMKSLSQPAGARSAAAIDLAMQRSPERESMDLDLDEEQKKRKRLLETQRFGGTMSAAYMSLLGESGNQF